jgi:cytochrome c biogenesis protein CcmG/thiol:disulfide interchange protein DsbE
MRIARAVTTAAVFALLGLLVWDVAHKRGGQIAREVDSGKIVPAPIFALPRLTGRGRLSLASLRGKVVVVNFWASDCVPCAQEQATLNAAEQAWSGHNVVFLGVDEIELRGPARAYLTRHRVAYQSVSDGSGNVAGEYGVTATPETFLIDRRGRVVPPHIVGAPSPADLRAAIRRAVKS